MRLAGVERAAVIDKGGPSSESDCAKLNLLSWMDNIMTNLMLINLKRDSSYNNFISRTLRSRYTFTDSVSLFKFMLDCSSLCYALAASLLSNRNYQFSTHSPIHLNAEQISIHFVKCLTTTDSLIILEWELLRCIPTPRMPPRTFERKYIKSCLSLIVSRVLFNNDADTKMCNHS